MFVRCVRATVVVLAITWAGSAMAQDRPVPYDPVFESPADAIGEAIAAENGDAYVATPSDSFIVEHSNQVAAAAPRASSSRENGCREYSADEDSTFAEGIACPQADGSWRIESRAQNRPSQRRAEVRANAPYSEYPDYTDDEREERETARPASRFRLDWDTWSSARRGSPARSNGYRNE